MLVECLNCLDHHMHHPETIHNEFINHVQSPDVAIQFARNVVVVYTAKALAQPARDIRFDN